MKKLLLLLFSSTLTATMVKAQSNPAPQSLPYQQTFDALPATSTAYPDGWQGWTLAGSPSGNFNTAAPAADKALATGTASSTTNGTYNYNGKLGFLNSGSADISVVLAINTTGQSNISMQYDVATLRNPYDGSSNTRVNEVILQYRVGTTGTFTSITGTEYQNNTTQQTTSGVTTPQHPATESILLPAACENQPVVQLRWVNRQISGAGSRPSFMVDNINVGGGAQDTTRPTIIALQPAAGDTAQPTLRPAVTFSENIQFGTGNAVLHNLTSGTTQVIGLGAATASISNNLLTLNVKLSPNQAYFLTLDSNAVQDIFGNAFTGLTDSSWHFATGPQVTSFDFNTCTPAGSNQLAGGFTQYAVTGNQKWACSTFGQNSTNGLEINGYSSGPQANEQWLISPAFNLTGYTYPLLSFNSEVAFTGPSLQLVVSTDYDGVSNPHTATWTPVNGRFPGADQANTWALSTGINLAAFKDSSVYVAFIYTSSPTLNAARWDIDNFNLVNSATPPPPSVSNTTAGLAFDYVKAGSVSVPQAFTFYGNDFTGPLTITAPTGFKVSKDSTTFTSSITYTLDEVNAGLQTAFAEFAPAATNTNYADSLRFISTGLNQAITGVSGTSLHSLKVVNWNMEWFGSTEQDPANDSLQQANATVVMRNLNADIFALAEVVDTARISAIASQLGYKVIVSDFGSYADSATDVDYPSAQKLAFMYKPEVIRGIRSYGIMRYNASPTAYKNWSSGRFPFYFETEAKLDNDSARIGFFVIHGKANTGTTADKIDSYNRRLNGNKEFKDSLDAEYRHTNFLILGDFNDALNKTITAEMAPDTTTSYIDFMNDSVDYKPITLPLALAGKKSTVSNANVIDNVIASEEMAMAYLPNSAQVADYVAKLVSSYGTTTTDHYPVMSRYNLHILATPAPVTDFTAKDNNGTVDLAWNTSYEINTSHFIVERSANNRDFNPVDTVAAQGTTTLPTTYTSQDKHPYPGTSYYRLKTVLRDSSFAYSNVQSVTLTLKESIFQLLWSLLGHNLQIWIDWPQKGTCQGNLQLIDLFGRIRYNSPVTLNQGRNTKVLDVNNVPSGIYFLRVQSGTQVKTSTIVIAR